MSLIFSPSSPSSIIPSSHNQFKFSYCNSKFLGYNTSNPSSELFLCRIPWKIPSSIPKTSTFLRNHPPNAQNFTSGDRVNANDETSDEENTIDFDWGRSERGDEEDTGSPWEGAIVYRRNPSISHVEYCTTLERLGLGELSTEVSKSRASEMGLRVTKTVKDYPLGTPVQISMDVTRKKHKLRLDGIIRTVLTLGCNRCGEPAAECVFSNFTLLLTEEPIEEPEVINMGVIFGEDTFRTSTGSSGEEEDDEASIDLDDRLYFPAEEKEIDISKHIRDMVHVEITITTICSSGCKGLCLRCGMNLNTSSCSCSKQEVKEKSYGPLGNLRKQMQQE
ncbi:hypothetical protein HHK36_014642 [Tetracentron sinense]|uniref:Large ribosomal RNA subunit accumulation protein YCED homolog 1, chloroplastic n=1 Tax=Tetracentron sinense TaxID=13715 RepID=A0A834YZD0_TETSI|nr:hypothetical protein HHK36_014642 [Tetracentron sinense]